ncbi:MAG: S9 family peptidase [Actinobacteria bacterium]|nr:S9 family peptidase [Actinomycetota bacterium]
MLPDPSALPLPRSLVQKGSQVTDSQMHPSGRWASAILTTVENGVRRHSLWMWAVDGSSAHELLVDPEPAAGYELSGGVHEWNIAGDRCAVVTRAGAPIIAAVNDDLVLTAVLEVPVPEGKSWSTPAWAPDGQSFVVIADWREVWLCDSNGIDARCIYDHSDFVFDPTWWNGVPTFTAWDRPQMPWTESAVVNARRESVVSLTNVSHQQARSSADGRVLGVISDRSGYSNMSVINADGSELFALKESYEHAPATWGPGARTWCFNSEHSHIAFTRNENGFGSLNVADLSTGEVTRLGNGVHGCVSWVGDTIVAVRSGARTPQQMVAYDVRHLSLTPEEWKSKRTILCDPDGERWRATDIAQWLVEPIVDRCHTAHGDIPFRLYESPRTSGALICWIHGGPNDQWQVTFRPRLNFWLSRGFDIAVLDHRGSTGHGRAFLDSLNGGWGDRDAVDALAVLDHLCSTGNYTTRRTVLMGGSAGGLTVLAMLAQRPAVAGAAVVSYPVVDLLALAHGDDPFETHHVPLLVGATSVDDEVLTERSPLRHATNVASVSLLVFHGTEDKVVPLEQSLALLDAVESAGGVIRLEVMTGEGHGFSNPDAIDHEYAVTCEFLAEYGLNLSAEPGAR